MQINVMIISPAPCLHDHVFRSGFISLVTAIMLPSRTQKIVCSSARNTHEHSHFEILLLFGRLIEPLFIFWEKVRGKISVPGVAIRITDDVNSTWSAAKDEAHNSMTCFVIRSLFALRIIHGASDIGPSLRSRVDERAHWVFLDQQACNVTQSIRPWLKMWAVRGEIIGFAPTFAGSFRNS